MYPMMDGAGTGVWMLAMIFLVVLGVLWFFLPFAVFGTKPLLRELIAEQRQTNRWLETLANKTPAGQAARSGETGKSG